MRRGLLIVLLTALAASSAMGQQARTVSKAIPPPAPPDSGNSRPGETTFTPITFPLRWDLATASHFARRAGFAAGPEELHRYLDQGFEATLDEMLDTGLDDSAMEAGLAARNYTLTRTNQNGQLRPNALNLGRWWNYRMLHSRRQLVEKMTLFWHDHFATSLATVNQVKPSDVAGQQLPLVLIQNELLRKHALGNFKVLVHEIARDPAMLVWLDNRINFVGRPNENWARELLELFTIGIGNYTETDVQEAARAFTGWTLDRRTLNFIYYPPLHDSGDKTFLGVTGNLDGDDIINIVFEQQETARFIARKLFEYLVYADPSDDVIEPLAKTFRESGYEIEPLVRAILTGPDFYSDRARRAQIKSPVELVVSTARQLGVTDPVFLNQFSAGMGQQLFVPPDVGGWTTGTGWINTTTALGRYNFFNYLAVNRSNRNAIDLEMILEDPQIVDATSLVESLLNRFVQGEAPNDTVYALVNYLETDDAGMPTVFDLSDPITVDKKVRGVIYLALTLPLYQLN